MRLFYIELLGYFLVFMSVLINYKLIIMPYI